MPDTSKNVEAAGPPEPREGGLQAWLVVFASFLVNGLVFGVINSYSVLYFELQKNLENAGVPDSSSKASLVGSLTIGATFAVSPVAGVLTDRLGLRRTALLGGCLAVVGMLISSLLSDQVEALYLTYGIMFGVGASLAYTPSLAILGLHFKKRMGVVNGLVTTGSSVFTIVLPPVMALLLEVVGVDGALRVLALAMTFLIVAALLFRVPPGAIPPKPKQSSEGKKLSLSSIINVEIWRKKRYVIWVLVLPTAMFGYFVPYVHMVKFVSLTFPENNGAQLVMCIGVTSLVGRLIFGKISDLPGVDRILLQQFSFIAIGILTMLLTVAPAWGYMIAIALGMGLFDGCFISLIGPIAFDLCGPTGGAQGIGFLLGLFSIPLTLGPPLAGMMYDSTQSYFWPFLLSGLPPIIGGLLLFLVRCVPPDPMDASEIIASKVARDAQETGQALVDPTAATGADAEQRVSEGTSLLAQDPAGSGGGVNTNNATSPPNYIERESNC